MVEQEANIAEVLSLQTYLLGFDCCFSVWKNIEKNKILSKQEIAYQRNNSPEIPDSFFDIPSTVLKEEPKKGTTFTSFHIWESRFRTIGFLLIHVSYV
jgi:hypothetical protein